MKKSQFVAVIATLVCAVGVPLASVASAAADTTSLQCSRPEIQIDSFNNDWKPVCDLGLTKDVSANGAAFVAADTAASAVSAQVGDTLTWKVTLDSFSSEGYTPFGQVSITDVLPSTVSLVSFSVSAGNFADNTWTVPLTDNLPATLTVTTKATTVGQVVNTATITGYTTCEENTESKCEDPTYVDSNADNNTNSAYVNVAAVPVVTPVTPAAPHTGFGAGQSNVATTIASFGIMSAVLGAAAVVSRRALQK